MAEPVSSSVKDYCSAALEIVQSNYVELTHLPIDSMLPWLFVQNVITQSHSEMIQTFPLSAQRMEYILDNIIIPSLHNNVIVKFQAFLEVMKQSDDSCFIDLARKLDLQQKASYIGEPSVNTTGDRPSLRQLVEVIRIKDINIVPRWRDLGYELLHNAAIVHVIEVDYRDDVKACHQMFENWLETSPDASWSRLITALKNIQMNTAAESISKLFKSNPLDRNELKLGILQSMSKARKDGCSLKVRYGKVLLCGASGAGKSNFLNLLMEDEFQEDHNPTQVVKPHQVTAMKTTVSKYDNTQKIVFEKMDIDKEIEQLTRHLPKQYIKPEYKSGDEKSPPELEIQKSCTIPENIISDKFANSVEVVASQSDKTWDVLTFVDIGGQPQFISIADPLDRNELKLGILQSMSKARKDGCSLKVWYGKVLLCGASGAGKSNFLNLLMEDEFQEDHNPTQVVKPHQVTAMKTTVSKYDNTQKIVFEKMDIDKEIEQLTRHLPKQYIKPEYKSGDEKSPPELEIQKSCTIPENIISDKFANSVEVVASQSDKTWDVLTFVDTGGQPRLINMLPALNSFAMITFIVHKLAAGKNSLKKKVEVQRGDRSEGVPEYAEYTYNQLIKTLMSYASSLLLPDKEFLNDYKTCPESCVREKWISLISIIGTHSDDVSENDIKEIDNDLSEMQKVSYAKNIKPELNKKYGYLVPVDSKLQGINASADDRKKVAADKTYTKFTDPSRIRHHIHNLLNRQDTYDVPIQWILLELHMRKVCEDRDNCSLMTYEEIVKISENKNLGGENDVNKALTFHHLFGVLLYFDFEIEGRSKLIIVNHQWLYDKLTVMVENLETGIGEQFDDKKRGIIDETLLDKLKLDISSDLKKSEINAIDNPNKYFLELLQHLRIIAPLKIKSMGQYFMPSLCSSCDLTKVPNIIPGTNKFIIEAKEENSEPFLFLCKLPNLQLGLSDKKYYGSFPRGIFNFLVVQLMQSKKWEPYGESYDNLVSFNIEETGRIITLIDRIFCLEVQVTRHKAGNDSVDDGIFITIRNAIVDAFDEVTNTNALNISIKLNFGFWCKDNESCANVKEDHIFLLKGNPLSYCTHGVPTRLITPHMVWFETFKDSPIEQRDYLEARPETKQLLEVMRNISFVNEWYELGLWLCVSDVDLNIFKTDCATDVTGRCQKMLQKWLEKTCNASWSQLVTALDKIELHSAAKAVSEYCKSGFTKYDDIAAKVNNSIQESELKSIRDFLDSVDLRFKNRDPLFSNSKPDADEPESVSEVKPQTYTDCIKSSDTATDAEISVQEPELKNINVLNPVDPRVGVNHPPSTESWSDINEPVVVQSVVVTEVKHRYCLYGAIIIGCAAIIIPLILQALGYSFF